MGNYRDGLLLIENSNLPSGRWKVRRIRTARDRELRRLHKESRRVAEQIRMLGYEELTPPVQRGYKRLFVLTEETKMHDKAGLYQCILNSINTIWYSPVKAFKRDRKRKIAKWKYRRIEEQALKEIELSAYLLRTDGLAEYVLKAYHITEEQLPYFSCVEYYSNELKRWCVKLVFNEPWRYALRVRPNIITTVRRKNLALERYLDELEKRLERDKGRKLKVLYGGQRNSWHCFVKKYVPKEKYKDYTLKNKPIHEIMEAYKEKKQLWEYEPKI